MLPLEVVKAMLRSCPRMRRCLWIAAPLVAAHAGCLALPAATVALTGTAIVLPICGQVTDGEVESTVAAAE